MIKIFSDKFNNKFTKFIFRGDYFGESSLSDNN